VGFHHRREAAVVAGQRRPGEHRGDERFGRFALFPVLVGDGLADPLQAGESRDPGQHMGGVYAHRPVALQVAGPSHGLQRRLQRDARLAVKRQLLLPSKVVCARHFRPGGIPRPGHGLSTRPLTGARISTHAA
jgi:hypothetical protein